MSVFIQTKTPMIRKVTWLSEAMGDPALFQATLLPSALHHAMFYERDLTESFNLFNVTTGLVKKKLNDPELGISDNNIAAVVCLSFFEVGASLHDWSCVLLCLWLFEHLRTSSATLRPQMFT